MTKNTKMPHHGIQLKPDIPESLQPQFSRPILPRHIYALDIFIASLGIQFHALVYLVSHVTI